MSTIVNEQIFLTDAQALDMFEEQKAFFVDVISNGNVFRPKAEFFYGAQRIASLTYPSFSNQDEFESAFNKGSWFPRIISADEVLLYLDISCELQVDGSIDTKESDVFLMLHASTDYLGFKAAPYHIAGGETLPTWDDSLTMSENDVYSIKPVIFALHVGITQRKHNLNEEVVCQYLETNGFTIDFYHPMSRETIRASKGFPVGI